MARSLIILGAGYTARFVLPLATRYYDRVFATSRQPDRHLTHVPQDRRLRFDLREQETWRNLPRDCDLLWCFPAEPRDQVQAFAAALNLKSHRLVVLGSTSAYGSGASNEYPPPWLDETAVLDTNNPRVQGEEFLRRHCNAIVLLVAGIYGPGRNPLDWIKTGRVGSSRKYVNFIHVEDLAEICLVALEHGRPGNVYNVSDGTPRTWSDICRRVLDRWGIQPSAPIDDRSTGKRIANEKLLSLLGAAHKSLAHTDLYRSLEQLQIGEEPVRTTP